MRGSLHPVGKYAFLIAALVCAWAPILDRQGFAQESARPATQQSLDEKLVLLTRLIAATSDGDPQKPELIFQLAELYSANSEQYHAEIEKLGSRIQDAKKQNNNALVESLKTERLAVQEKQRPWIHKAEKRLEEITEDARFQHYAKMDRALFYRAYCLIQLQREEEGRNVFKRLIKGYPQSPFLPHAYLAFGEYFFENRDLENALKFYDKVLQYSDSPVYGYALYKKGWVYYNLTDFKPALATFIDVIFYATNPKRKDKKSDALLAKEAKKDMVRTFAQIGSPDKAWTFFQKYGKDYAPVMLEQLADLYNAQGKFSDSVQVYRQIIELSVKKHAFEEKGRLCGWQTEILKNTLAMTGKRAVPETVRELQRLSAVYEQFRERKDLPTKELLDECRDNTAGMLRDLATTWHSEAQKTGVMDTYANASDLYKEYIRRFPKEKDSYLMHFGYAELLFRLGSLDNTSASHWYCDAAPIYTDVVKMDPKGPKQAEAAFAMVVSWGRCLDIDLDWTKHAPQVLAPTATRKSAKRNPPANKLDGAKTELETQPKPIPEPVQKMLEALDIYVQNVTDVPALPVMKYHRARFYYEYNHYDRAIALFKDLAETHSNSEQALPAANLLLDCLAIKSRSEAGRAAAYTSLLEDQLRSFERIQVLAREEKFSARIREAKFQLMQSQAEAAEKLGDYHRAASLYQGVIEIFPRAVNLAELYNKAALNYDKAHLIGLGQQTREALIRLKPDDPLSKNALYRLAQSYAFSAVYELAAEKYELYAQRYPHQNESIAGVDTTHPFDAAKALVAAIFYRRSLGQIDKAIEDADLFIKTYGGSREYYDRAAGIFLDMGESYEQLKNYPRHKQHLLEYQRYWANKGGIDRQIVVDVRLGVLAWNASCPVSGEHGTCVEIKRERLTSATLGQLFMINRGKAAKPREASIARSCDSRAKSKVTVFERRASLLSEAVDHFQKALHNCTLFAKQNSKVELLTKEDGRERLAQLRHACATASIKLSDKNLEEWLPQRRYDLSTLTQLEMGYSEMVKSTKDDESAVLAQSRIGFLYFMAVEEECAHKRSIDDLDRKTRLHLNQCLELAKARFYDGAWLRLCDDLLQNHAPRDYPLSSEAYSPPGYQQVSMDFAPMITSVR